jgi:hypothetical protein
VGRKNAERLTIWEKDRKAGIRGLSGGEIVLYPYATSLDVIEQVHAYMDVHQRGAQLQGDQPPLYMQSTWYFQNFQSKSTIPDFVWLPSSAPLGMTEFNKMRGAPIGMIGLSGIMDQRAHVDGHQQSALEFWLHDVNHNRRFFQQFENEAKKLNPGGELDPLSAAVRAPHSALVAFAEESTAWLQKTYNKCFSIKKQELIDEKNTTAVLESTMSSGSVSRYISRFFTNWHTLRVGRFLDTSCSVCL